MLQTEVGTENSVDDGELQMVHKLSDPSSTMGDHRVAGWCEGHEPRWRGGRPAV
jgi:hypothetical protein